MDRQWQLSTQFMICQITTNNQPLYLIYKSQFHKPIMQHSTDQARFKLAINNLHACDIATDDLIKFRKVRVNGWQSIRSSKPLEKGRVYIFSIQILAGDGSVMIGIGQKNDNLMNNHHFGQYKNSLAYSCINGQKSANSYAWTEYGKKANIGDKVTMKVDLVENQGCVEYLINGNSQGLAYAGVNEWQNIYFGLSLQAIGVVIKIVEQKLVD